MRNISLQICDKLNMKSFFKFFLSLERDFKNLLFLLIHIILLYPSGLIAQVEFKEIDYISVSNGTDFLKYPWGGGLNSAQFCSPDLNGDGLRDLLVYEKSEDRVLTFIANEKGGYLLDRSYMPHIPKINGWVITKDMNCDGVDELMTYYNGSIMVYEGYRHHDTLKFDLWVDGIYYRSGSGKVNLYSTFIDRPAIVDVDADGDLDILTFDVSDSRILWYKNERAERNLACDTLVFTLKDNCWGNVYETELNPLMKLRDTCSYKIPMGKVNTTNWVHASKMMHAGSTLEAVDIGGRGVIDLLIGDVTFNFLNLLRNYGSREYASILSQDTSFPAYDIPVYLASFPSSVFIDIDHDGKKDLIVTPFDGLGVDNYDNVWWYKNVGRDTVKLSLQTKSFIVGDMIDVGENAVPTMIDINGNGLKDLLISGTYSRLGKQEHRIHYYKNIGTASYPVYELEDSDFLNYKDLTVRDEYQNIIDISEPYVHAGDLDGDGNLDVIVGVRSGMILYFKNTSSKGFVSASPQILKSNGSYIDVGLNAAPFIIDLDRDGKQELLVGSFNGNVRLYKNIGSKNEVGLELMTDSVGKVSSTIGFIPFGYSAVAIADIDGDGKYDMILGGFNNYLKYVSNIEDSIYHKTTPKTFHSLPNMIGKRIAPYYTHVTNNKDGTLLLGLLAGGVRWYSQNPPEEQTVSIENSNLKPVSFKLYPNPNSGHVEVYVPNNQKILQWEIVDVQGRLWQSGNMDNERTHLELSSLTAGVYVFYIIERGNILGYQMLVKVD